MGLEASNILSRKRMSKTENTLATKWKPKGPKRRPHEFTNVLRCLFLSLVRLSRGRNSYSDSALLVYREIENQQR